MKRLVIFDAKVELVRELFSLACVVANIYAPNLVLEVASYLLQRPELTELIATEILNSCFGIDRSILFACILARYDFIVQGIDVPKNKQLISQFTNFSKSMNGTDGDFIKLLDHAYLK